jgi:hypothetical protein
MRPNVIVNLDKLKSDIKRWGLTRTIFSHIMRRVERYLGIHIHVVRSTAMIENPQYPSIPANITLREIPPKLLLTYISNPALQLSREFVQSAIDRGDLAFGAFDGPTLVSYVWRTFTSAPHTGKLWVRVTRPYCYAYKSLTLPKYRGQRIAPAIHIFSDVEMFKRGFTHRAGFVAVANSASLAMGKHMGTRAIGYAGYLDWFGHAFTFRTKAVRNIGFEFYERD